MDEQETFCFMNTARRVDGDLPVNAASRVFHNLKQAKLYFSWGSSTLSIHFCACVWNTHLSLVSIGYHAPVHTRKPNAAVVRQDVQFAPDGQYTATALSWSYWGKTIETTEG